MPNFTGTLNANEIYASLFNMIISQQVFADNLSHAYNLVDEAREDGGLYGDTKLYYSTDVLKSHKWGNDAEAGNLLALDRPKAPQQQAIVLKNFRQIRLTLDEYLSKRAWMSEGAFGQFNSVMLSWMTETKKVYENTLYNTRIGNMSSDVGSQTRTLTLTLPQGVIKGTEEANRLTGQFIAEQIANLIDELKDYSRAFNDYGNLRSYDEERLKFVWNTEYVNKIKYIDLPTIFHNEELRKHLTDRRLTPRYFGSGITATNEAVTEGQRTADEIEIENVDYFAGDKLVAGTGNNIDKLVYQNDNTIMCKVFVKLPPFMSAFVVGTSFFNPRSLTQNRYLTWGFNDIEYLKNYPVITLKLIVNEA